MSRNETRFSMRLAACAVIVLCSPLVTAKAWGATWYVDAATGSSSHSGKSMNDAFASIQTAIDKSSADDVVLVNDGIYTAISSQNKAIVIKSINGAKKTTIDGNGNKCCAYLRGNTYNDTNTVLVGFTLQNGCTSSNYGAGALCGSLRNCVIRQNKVVGGYYYGGGAAFSYVDGCTFDGNTSEGNGGAVWECECINSIFSNNTAMCGAAAAQCRLFGCVLIGNIATKGGATSNGTSYNCLIVGNCAPQGAGVYYSSAINCIIWDNYKTGTTELANYTSGSSISFSCTSPTHGGEGNICEDPNFVDPDNGDYHLRIDSPCIDTAMTLQILSEFESIKYDADGAIRLMGWGMDMGPYEKWQDSGRDFNKPYLIYVDKAHGDNSNTGRDKQHPFASISKAISIACEGDVISVNAGVYSRIETRNKSITIASEKGPANTVIDANAEYFCVCNSSYFGVPTNACIIGFTLRNGANYGGVYGGTYKNCILTKNTSNWTGNSYGGGATYAHLINCLVKENISATGNGAGGLHRCWIENCTIVNNQGDKCGGVSDAFLLCNSVVYGNAGGDVNDVFSSSDYATYSKWCNCCGNALAGGGNITNDPAFVDASIQDYRLADDSPCVNAGATGYVQCKYDLDGNPRIKGKVVDMGAFENQTAHPGAEVGYATARQRYPWNGLVDVQFDVFGLSENEKTNVVMRVVGDSLADQPLVTFPERGLSGLSNGTWNCVWDAGTDAPRVLDSNAVVTVSLPDGGDSCRAAATKIDTRSQPRDAADAEELIISADWQSEIDPENVTATLTQTRPGYRAEKLSESTGGGDQRIAWNAAAETVPGIHLFTLTLADSASGKVLKTMTSSFTVADPGGGDQPLFTDEPVQIPQSFSSWNGIGTFLNESRAGLLRVNGMTAVPPTTNIVVISLGEFAVPSSMLASLPDTVTPTVEYGVDTYRLHVREIGDGTSDLVAKIGDVAVSELTIPAYNPDRWVEALYGTPPTWLTGEARTAWYAARDLSRIEWYMTLVSQNDIADYRANRAAALAEAAEDRPDLSLSGLSTHTSADALHAMTVNAKADSVVDVFGKRTLNETNWTYAGRAFIPAGDSAVGVVSDDLSYFMTVVRVADVAEGGGAVETQGDSDCDGIPDSVEAMTYGTNPDSPDTSGGGIGDWDKIYVYGLDPLVTDTDGDGYDDIEELMCGTDPKAPAAGADASIRYYYDDDGRLTRIHFGSHGAMSSVTLTPEGNPQNVKEKAK